MHDPDLKVCPFLILVFLKALWVFLNCILILLSLSVTSVINIGMLFMSSSLIKIIS